MAITLRKEALSFGYNYIIGQNRVKYKNALSRILDLEELEKFLNELDEFYSQMPETEDIQLYSNEEVVVFEDVRNSDPSKRTDIKTKDHVGGDRQFIQSSLAKKEWFYELLENRIKALLKGKDSNEEVIEQPVPNLSIDEIFEFLSLHFKIDIEKDEFISTENHTYVTISGSPFKLWRKDLTKYMIGYIFKYFFEKHIWFHKRLIFKYVGQGYETDLYYLESLKALSNKEREIKKNDTSDKDFKIFKSNLEKQLLLFQKI